MLVGLLKFVFDVVIFLLGVCMGLLIAYVLMTLLIPQHKYTLLLGKYVEPFLAPVRALIGKLFPKLAEGRIVRHGALLARLYQTGVDRVVMTAPLADIDPGRTGVARASSITIEVVT